MGLLENELVDYLVTKGVISEKKVDGFVNLLPDIEGPDGAGVVLAIKQTGGVPSVGTPDPWIAIQVLVRSDDSYFSARMVASEVYTYFHEMINATTNSFRIIASKATALPQSLGEDDRRRYLVSVNFLFNVVALTQFDGGGDDGGGFGGSKDPVLPDQS